MSTFNLTVIYWFSKYTSYDYICKNSPSPTPVFLTVPPVQIISLMSENCLKYNSPNAKSSSKITTYIIQSLIQCWIAQCSDILPPPAQMKTKCGRLSPYVCHAFKTKTGSTGELPVPCHIMWPRHKWVSHYTNTVENHFHSWHISPTLKAIVLVPAYPTV